MKKQFVLQLKQMNILEGFSISLLILQVHAVDHVTQNNTLKDLKNLVSLKPRGCFSLLSSRNIIYI